SNVVEVFGDLEDDGHLDALDAKDPKHDSGDNGKFMDDLVDDTKKKESDDDVDVDNGCDDTATSSKSLGNSLGGNT
nr:hypothetical protein [Tanacetum cinerariifolium]